MWIFACGSLMADGSIGSTTPGPPRGLVADAYAALANTHSRHSTLVDGMTEMGWAAAERFWKAKRETGNSSIHNSRGVLSGSRHLNAEFADPETVDFAF